MSTAQTNRAFIESKRAAYMGLEDDPRLSLDSAIKTLAEDLYAKDTHFIFELIQNAEDNNYAPGVRPTLRFILEQMEYQGKTQPCLIVENNETGFLKDHVQALCRVGQSTKSKNDGYIGEKGIGFKSVFRVTDCPQVHSNGFHFSLPETDEESGLGYIVPSWVQTPPANLHAQTTTIILPIKAAIEPQTIASYLKDIAPETILFLSQLSVIEIRVNLPDISYEIVMEKSILRPSLVALTHLKRENAEELIESTHYWLAFKSFDKPVEISSSKRTGIKSREVRVAIPLDGEHTHPGKLFAYLPVWESTGIPFLVNADFLLVSSREGLHEDESWNTWLRACIAPVYIEGLLSCLRDSNLPIKDRVQAYASVPIQSHHAFLEPVIAEVQRGLREQACILTSQSAELVVPKYCRLVGATWRALLEGQDTLPSPIGSDHYFVHSAVPPHFDDALKALGVSSHLKTDVVICLNDTAWLKQRSYEWLIELYRAVRGFDSGDFADLRIVPSVLLRGKNTEFQCGFKHPIYFRPDWEEARALRDIPLRLLQARPVSFLPKEFQRLIDSHKDSEELQGWMTASLRVFRFTAENFCIDALEYLENEMDRTSKTRIVEITRYLVAHAGSQFNWESLPIVLSDDRRMAVCEARKLRYVGLDHSERQIRALVVPENYAPKDGWQHIWREKSDREHFVVLNNAYSKLSSKFFGKVGAALYPGMSSLKLKNETSCKHPLEKVALEACHSKAASSRYWNTELHSWRLPKFPDAMTKECAGAILGWLRSLDLQQYAPDDLWKCGLKIKGTYHNYGQGTEYFRSPLLEYLRRTAWLPTSKGLSPPISAYLRTPEAEEIFGTTVAYFKDELPLKLLKLLGVRTSITVDTLIDQLWSCRRDSQMHPKLPEIIYRHLSTRLPTSQSDLESQPIFPPRPIYIPSSTEAARWFKPGACIWVDASSIFGDEFQYLEPIYPKLKDFFIQNLGVKQEVDAECYARHWLKLQESTVKSDKSIRPTVDVMYRKVRDALRVKPKLNWLKCFLEEAKLYTQSDGFVDRATLVIPDDGDLRQLFEGEVDYAWRPAGDSFSDWGDFYDAFDLVRLSECVVLELADDIDTVPVHEERLLTGESVQMIASWLREKQRDIYDRMILDGVFKRLLEAREERSEQPIRLKYTLNIDHEEFEKIETADVFLDDQNARLVLGPSEEDGVIKQAAAKQLAKFILGGLRDKYGLADWIELVLGASDTKRLKSKNWYVPREILQLCSDEANKPDLPGIEEGATSDSVRQAHEDQIARAGGSPNQRHGDNYAAKPLGHEAASRPSGTSSATKMSSPQGTKQSLPTIEGAKPERATDVSAHEVYQSYAEMLNNSLNQPGENEVGEDWVVQDAFSGGSLPNPGRRTAKLEEEHRERIENEPDCSERRRYTERQILELPDPRVGQTLLEWYGGKCQICGNTWPERHGRPYFVTARLVERQHARWLDDPANAVCLCAEHFAQWRHASKEPCEGIVEQLQDLELPTPVGSDGPAVRFKLLGEEVRIQYNEKHLLALKTLVEVFEQPSVK